MAGHVIRALNNFMEVCHGDFPASSPHPTSQPLLNTFLFRGHFLHLMSPVFPGKRGWGRGQELTFSAFFVTGVQTWADLGRWPWAPPSQSLTLHRINPFWKGWWGNIQLLETVVAKMPSEDCGGTQWQRVVATGLPRSSWQCNGTFFLVFGHPARFSGPSEDAVSYWISFAVKFHFHLS